MSEKRENISKRFVKVRADHLTNGHIKPLMFREDEGPVCRIDRIIDEREAPSLKAGGQGTRYICLVQEKCFVLFHDGDYWFIEL